MAQQPLKANKAPMPSKIPDPTNPDNIRAVYSNLAGFGATLTDVQLIFTLVTQTVGPRGQAGPENRVVAMVTLPLAQLDQMIVGLNSIRVVNQANQAAQQEVVADHMENLKK